PAMPRLRRLFANSPANITPMLPRTRNKPRRSSRKSTRPMRFSAMPPSARNMTNSGRTGVPDLSFGRRLAGKGFREVEALVVADRGARNLSFSSGEQALAIFSNNYLARRAEAEEPEVSADAGEWL